MPHALGQPEAEIDWPPWIPFFAAIIPVAIAVEVVIHRGVLWPPTWETGLAFLAVLPFLLDCAQGLVPIRTSLPPLVFSAVVIAPTTVLLLEPTDLDFLPFLFVFLCAEMTSRLRPPLGAAITAACVGVMVGLEVAGEFQGSFIWVVGILFGAFAGFAMQRQLLLTTRLQEAQAELVERSAAEERQRIAREVHDVIAHSMSVTMLHVTAARMALERERPHAALEALREAEQQGRNSLNDIRRTVGLLGPDEGATAPPMPTAADITKLVGDFRSAGLDVELSVRGDARSIPPAAGLNLYRIVQESLTNVAKHAPGASAVVEMNVDEDGIRLRVHNGPGNGAAPAPQSSGGLGLKGMAGRAAMLGGSFAADGDGGGWTVSLQAPRPRA